MHLPVTYILEHYAFAYNHTWKSSLAPQKINFTFKIWISNKCYKLYTFSSEHQNENSVLKYRNNQMYHLHYKGQLLKGGWGLVMFQIAGEVLQTATERLVGRQIMSCSQFVLAPLPF